MLEYLRINLVQGLAVPPWHAPARVWLLAAGYGLLAAVIGFGTGLLGFRLLAPPLVYILPFTLLVFPALLEEAFFRGLVIPHNTLDRGGRRVVGYTALSTVLFTAWHPLNAVTINPGAAGLFFDPGFLVITALLGATCSIGYILSRSLWVPVIIHWATVVVWVCFLGGRNLLLEA